MRRIITPKDSTKSERRFHEFLKEARVPFRHRWLLHGYEVDFLVGKYAIEINGHQQDTERTATLQKYGYTPIHFPNEYVSKENKVKIQTWLRQIQSTQTA